MQYTYCIDLPILFTWLRTCKSPAEIVNKRKLMGKNTDGASHLCSWEWDTYCSDGRYMTMQIYLSAPAAQSFAIIKMKITTLMVLLIITLSFTFRYQIVEGESNGTRLNRTTINKTVWKWGGKKMKPIQRWREENGKPRRTSKKNVEPFC